MPPLRSGKEAVNEVVPAPAGEPPRVTLDGLRVGRIVLIGDLHYEVQRLELREEGRSRPIDPVVVSLELVHPPHSDEGDEGSVDPPTVLTVESDIPEWPLSRRGPATGRYVRSPGARCFVNGEAWEIHQFERHQVLSHGGGPEERLQLSMYRAWWLDRAWRLDESEPGS